MLSKLRFLFLPEERNNQKAKSLHLTSLFVLLFLAVAFQSLLTGLSRLKPGVLGFASNITIESLFELTNQEREKHGLNRLDFNKDLAEAAREKASFMFTFGCWSHYCNDRTPWWFFKNAGYNYSYAGENLARDFADSEGVVTAWMESPSHRDNVLNSNYEEIGFAVVDGILDGQETTLVVQLFGAPEEVKPAIASGRSTNVSQVEGVVEQRALASPSLEMMFSEVKSQATPIVSRFMLTKSFALLLLGLMIVIYILDTVFIYQRRIVRVSGKSFLHISFFIIILIAILLSQQGQII